MSHCTSCGKPLTPGLAFCTACGADIGAPFAPAQAPAPGAPPVALGAPPARVDAGAVIGESFRLVFRHFGAFLATQGVFLIVGALASLGLLIGFVRPAMAGMMGAMETFEADPAGFDPMAFFAGFLPLLGWGALSGVAVGLLSLLGGGFGLVAADMLRAGERVTMGTAWAKLRPRFGNYLATGLLVRLALLGVVLTGFVLFFLIVPIFAGIILAIVLYLRWALAAPASVFEERSPTQNLARSSALTKGARGDIFVVGLVAIAVSAIPGIVVGSLLGFAYTPQDTFAQPPLWVDVVRWAVGAAAQLASGFFLSAALVAFYRRLAP